MSADRPHLASLIGSIELRAGAGAAFTAQRVRLLESIDALGSLKRAAAALPMSYKAAWDALDDMNRRADAPLVDRRAGGSHGGGTRLTAHGQRIVTLYRALEQTQQTVLDRLPASADGDGAALRSLVRRLAVRSSARNQFNATVTALRDEGGRVEVALRLAGDEPIVVNVTPVSVRSMALAPGVDVHALIKAPWVDILLRPPRHSDGVNLLRGTVTAIEPDRTSTQIALRTLGGVDVVSTMPSPPAALRVGAPALARFGADSAILLRFDA